MNLKGKKVMVIGLARTGSETARFLVRQGAEVLVSDCRGKQELRGEVESLLGLPLRLLLGGEEVDWLDGVDTLVPSPGVPAQNPLLLQASRRGIEIISEVELASRFLRVPLVAITGTNGKSTTTTLIGEILKEAGISAFVGGNIGAPLIGFVSGHWDWGVVEVSSFQLEWVEQFRPRIAALLNLTEDHLDRYTDFASYCEAKGRIFDAQGKEDVAVLNRDDPVVWSLQDIVTKADHTESQHHKEGKRDVQVSNIGKEEGRDEEGKDDQRPPHGWGPGLGRMGRRSILPDRLSYLHLRQVPDQVGPNEKRDQEGHQARQGCTKGDVAQDIEDRIGSMKGIEQIV